jgi:hypothetical protein
MMPHAKMTCAQNWDLDIWACEGLAADRLAGSYDEHWLGLMMPHAQMTCVQNRNLDIWACQGLEATTDSLACVTSLPWGWWVNS